MSTLAQEELDRYLSSATESKRSHPDDHSDSDNLSAHEDNYPADGPDGDDTNHEMAQTATSLSVAASRTYHIPYKQFDANTGPKGVIADAQSYSRAKQSTFRKAFANITNTFALSKASTGSAITEKQNYSDSSSASDVDGEVTVLGEEEDEDFMREWRAKRLAELSSQHTTGSINGHGSQRRRVSPSKRTWGYLEDVDANGYLDAIEKVGNDVVVVVLIYDSGVYFSPFSFHKLSYPAKLSN